MRYSKKLPRKPLEDALFFISSAHEILLRVQRDASYIPDDYDFTLLQKIAEKGDRMRIVTVHTEIALRQRLKGEQETPLPPGFEP